MRPALVRQFLQFAGVGAIGTAVQYVILIALVWSSVDAVIASSAGFLAGAMVNYYLNYRFTFRSDKQHRDALPKFLAVAMVGFILNGGIMSLATDLLQIHYLVAQVAATGIVLIWNFGANKIWTFRKHAHAKQRRA